MAGAGHLPRYRRQRRPAVGARRAPDGNPSAADSAPATRLCARQQMASGSTPMSLTRSRPATPALRQHPDAGRQIVHHCRPAPLLMRRTSCGLPQRVRHVKTGATRWLRGRQAARPWVNDGHTVACPTTAACLRRNTPSGTTPPETPRAGPHLTPGYTPRPAAPGLLRYPDPGAPPGPAAPRRPAAPTSGAVRRYVLPADPRRPKPLAGRHIRGAARRGSRRAACWCGGGAWRPGY